MSGFAKELNNKLVQNIPEAYKHLKVLEALMKKKQYFHIYHKTDSIKEEVIGVPLHLLKSIRKGFLGDPTYRIEISRYKNMFLERFPLGAVILFPPENNISMKEFTDLAYSAINLMSLLNDLIGYGTSRINDIFPINDSLLFMSAKRELNESIKDLKSSFSEPHNSGYFDIVLINKIIDTVDLIRNHLRITFESNIFENYMEPHLVSQITTLETAKYY
jgi:hypothetical protein